MKKKWGDAVGERNVRWTSTDPLKGPTERSYGAHSQKILKDSQREEKGSGYLNAQKESRRCLLPDS